MTATVRRACALLLAALAALGYLLHWSRADPPETPDPNRYLADLVLAMGDQRATRGRLSGFSYGYYRQERGEGVPVRPDVLIAAARIEKSIPPVTANALNVLGSARLAAGDSRGAISAFSKAVIQASNHAQSWSNLAAAYLEHSAVEGIEMTIQSLNAAERAVRLAPHMPEAWFNLARARELVGYDAISAWQRFREVEPDSRWHQEAVQHERLIAADRLSARWDSSAHILDDAFASASRVKALCEEFPGNVRTHTEDIALAMWARAKTSGDSQRAEILRRRVATVGECIKRRLGDVFISDVAQMLRSPLLSVATAFRDYGKGRHLFELAQETDAKSAFEGAASALRGLDTPFGVAVEYQLATIDYQSRDLRVANVALTTISRTAQRRRYKNLEARTRVVLGSVLLQQGLLREAHEQYDMASRLVDVDADPDIAATAAYSAANVARLVGNTARGWRALVPAVGRVDRLTNLRRRLMVLYNASMLAEHDGLLYAARYFQDGALAAAQERGVAGSIVEAYTRRAALSDRLGQPADAVRDLASAKSEIEAVSDPIRLAYYRGLIDATVGQHLSRTAPEMALGHFDRAIGYFRETEPADVPGLLLRRGRINRSLGREAAAMTDYLAGIDALESLRSRTSDRRDSVSLFDSAWQLFGEMVALTQEDPKRAFEYAERGRARALVDAMRQRPTPLLGADEVAAKLPPRTAILQYSVLDDRVFLWLLKREHIALEVIRISSSDLSGKISDYVDALRSDDIIAEQRDAQSLYGILLAPVAKYLSSGDELVVVGDGALLSLPFASLIQGSTGRRLIEDFVVATAPSSNVYLASQESPRNVGTPTRVLAVGNPAFDQADYPGLRPLPASEQEAIEISRFYRQSVVLTGEKATKERFLSEFVEADVVHVGTHTVVNEEYPSESELLFADGGTQSTPSLSIAELARLKGRAPSVVVLGACGTARGTPYRLEGVMSLARAFLEVGTPHVVATMWDIEDSGAATLLVLFHRSVAAGASPSVALREAQMAVATGGDLNLRAPRHWAAYLVVGGTKW